MSDYNQEDNRELVDHFFRHEYAKMVAVITRYFGAGQVDLAEEIVQDTLLDALKAWDYKGLPPNPAAWLYTVAKNKALNKIKQAKYQQRYENEVRHSSVVESLDIPIQELFDQASVADDLLRMMFVCCHPSISPDSQIVLTLKTLCGLSIGEIANAYISSVDAVNKRLVRARKKLRKNNIQFELPVADELESRLDTVLETIYLLFNEGYNATSGNTLIRYELCMEAVRLTGLIVENPLFRNNSKAHALLALMLLNGSRFEARQDEEGNIIEMSKQNRSRWNRGLIDQGLWHLDRTNTSKQVSIYHILATISAYHCTAPDYEATNWPGILALYDGLIRFDRSPVILLNRAIAISKVHGNEQAISELLQLEASQSLKDYFPLYSTLAELTIEQKAYDSAIEYLTHAIELTELDSKIRLLKSKIHYCAEQIR